MTKILATDRRHDYTATAAQTIFPYLFGILDSDELDVFIDGMEQSSALYTVSNVGAETGGNVTFLAGLAGGEAVIVNGDKAYERTTDFADGQVALLAPELNDELSNIEIQVQQTIRDLRRTIRAPFIDKNPNLELPPAATRAGKFVKFADVSGDLEIAEFSTTATMLSQSVIAGFLTPQTPAEATAGVVPVNLQFVEYALERYGTPGGVDDTTLIDNWLKVAVAGQGYAILTPGIAALDGQLDVAAGIKGIIGAGGVIKAVGTGTVEPDYDGIDFDHCINVEIAGVIFDANNKFTRCFRLNNCQRFHIHGCALINLKQGSGINLWPDDATGLYKVGTQESIGHRIADNYFQGSRNILDVVQAIDFQVIADYGVHGNPTDYWKALSSQPVPEFRNSHCTITGNVTDGCRYAVQWNGAEHCTFVGNTCTNQSARGMIGGYGGFRNLFDANVILDFASTGLHAVFSTEDNTFSNNIVATQFGSEGGMYMILGARRQKLVNNKVFGTNPVPTLRFGIYVGIEGDGTEACNNTVRGWFTQPAMCMESAWDDATAEITSRAFAETAALTGFASNGMSNVKFKYNTIEVLRAPEYAIAMLQMVDTVQGGSPSYPLTNCSVIGNETVGSIQDKDLYLFEQNSGDSNNHVCTGNDWDAANDSNQFVFPRGRAHFKAFSNNEILDLGTQFLTFPVATGTPDVALGHAFKTGDAGAITDFLGGINGQTFELVADHAATVLGNLLTIGNLYSYKRVDDTWYQKAA